MKSKIEIENGWKSFVKEQTQEYLKSDAIKAMQDIGNELQWVMQNHSKEHCDGRIAKYERIFCDNIEATRFDPHWKMRIDFIRWCVEVV
jgi:hypothetical protein